MKTFRDNFFNSTAVDPSFKNTVILHKIDEEKYMVIKDYCEGKIPYKYVIWEFGQPLSLHTIDVLNQKAYIEIKYI